MDNPCQHHTADMVYNQVKYPYVRKSPETDNPNLNCKDEFARGYDSDQIHAKELKNKIAKVRTW